MIGNGLEVIMYNGKKWINQTQLGKNLGLENIAGKTQYYSSKYKRQRHEIQDWDDYQLCRILLDKELAVTIMLDTHRIAKAVEFRAKFGIKQYDPIMRKQQSIGSKIKKSF